MVSGEISFVTMDQIRKIRGKALEFLQSSGVYMDHPEMLKRLAAAGAQVDEAMNKVRFPREFVEEYLGMMPQKFTLSGYQRGHAVSLPHPEGSFYTRTCTGAPNWIDPDTGDYREVSIHDVGLWARLIQELDQIDFVPFPSPTDVPVATADVHALAVTLQNTNKHIWVQPYSQASVPFLIDLLIAKAGGLENLRQAPLASMITCSLTPFVFKGMDLEVILQAAPKGIPLFPCSLPTAGTTAPITSPGSVLVAVIENLVLLVSGQVVQPGIPMVATSLQFSADMQSGRSLQSSVEAIRQSAFFVQVMRKGFHVPAHTYGSGSDSVSLDAQCMLERAMQTMAVASSGADILGGFGQLETASTISPVQAVIDNEIVGMIRSLLSGFHLDDDVLGWHELITGKPGNEFLTSDHTLSHFRESFVPNLFIRQTRTEYERNGGRDLLQKTTSRYFDIIENASEINIFMNNDIKSILEAADKKLNF